eukprot:TRINITY_DN12815_c0_g1_i1.p1 TRINITY_DN12815_c0_g1~~TRINITY_DN12815_c0_g1_i1.p1  ORF type:complete len:255 (+),score=95.62 TRINITY_DN12815_c0_g1_i1:639-1403(+)
MIEKYELADKYWKTHVYDPVAGQYYDPIKEAEFLKYVEWVRGRKREEESKVHGKNQVKKLPVSVQKEGLMYNPVDMRVDDAERLQEKERRERQKKQRYELRHGIEENLRVKSIEEYEKSELQKRNRMHPRKYMEFTERGFDIFTNKKFDDPEEPKVVHKPLVPERPRVWDVIEYQKTLAKSQAGSYPDNSKAEHPPVKNEGMWQGGSVRRQGSNRSEQGKPVLSQAAAEQVATRSNRSNRSVRTGGFQQVPVNP